MNYFYYYYTESETILILFNSSGYDLQLKKKDFLKNELKEKIYKTEMSKMPECVLITHPTLGWGSFGTNDCFNVGLHVIL